MLDVMLEDVAANDATRGGPSGPSRATTEQQLIDGGLPGKMPDNWEARKHAANAASGESHPSATSGENARKPLTERLTRKRGMGLGRRAHRVNAADFGPLLFGMRATMRTPAPPPVAPLPVCRTREESKPTT